MRSQAHEGDEEDFPDEDEARNLLLPPAESRCSNSGGSGGISVSRKRTGLLWSSGDAFSAACGSGAAVAAVATPPTTAPHLCRPSAFVLDLSMLVRVFFVRGLFIEQRWLFPLLLAGTAVGYEVAASTVLNVIGEFYLAISSMDTPLFLQASGGGDCSTTAVGCGGHGWL